MGSDKIGSTGVFKFEQHEEKWKIPDKNIIRLV
jgi:hypothetical protein